MKNKKTLTAALALTLAAALLAGCSGTAAGSTSGSAPATAENAGDGDLLDKIQQAGVMIVGTEGTYSPNSYHNEEGELVGFDVDVARGVAEHLGVEIQFVEAEWDSLFASMDSGRIDLVVNEVEASEERRQKYDFSEPYTYVHGALLVGAETTRALLERLEGEVGLLIDTGNWDGPDKYAQIAAVAGGAECSQVKVRESSPGVLDAEDISRSLAALAQAGYSGRLSLVYAGSDDDEWGRLAQMQEIVGRVLA